MTQNSARWRRVGEAEGVVVYENLRALPRAWLAPEAVPASEAEILETIRTGRLPSGQEWEPRRTALVEGPAGLGTAAPGADGRVEFARREPNRVELRTTSPGASVLVLAENHYPGWRAEVDGRGVETRRVDYNLRGVELPAGQHTVRFVYRPKSALLGLLVSLLTLAGLLVWQMKLRVKDGELKRS